MVDHPFSFMKQKSMIEVFRTNVGQSEHADRLIALIHENFDGYRANFDLSDCDRILRVCSEKTSISAHPIISLLMENGFRAEVLPDTPATSFAASLVSEKVKFFVNQSLQ